jgi:predicted nucleotidyltransferase
LRKTLGRDALQTEAITPEPVPYEPPPTVQEARQISEQLAKSLRRIDTVLLFGSVARGDADEWSDIDLLVTASDAKLTPSRIRKALSRITARRISLIYYPTEFFVKQYRSRALFIAHLKKEGIALLDRQNILKTLMNRPFVPRVEVSESIKRQLKNLSAYSDPKRFNNNFLFCLSHIYSIGKAVVMLGLANQGVLEFNRESAFETFASLHPDLRRETNRVSRLRPFYRLVTQRKPERLPFSYRTAGRQVQSAVTAVRRLAERAESADGASRSSRVV